jgi:esterase/lipase
MLNTTPKTKKLIDFPPLDKDLSFADYIKACQELISCSRGDLNQKNIPPERIIAANSPFELVPNHTTHSIGALLIHGLFDSPFSLRELGLELQSNGILTRAVLLPGHGTTPQDLFLVSYQDWIKTVAYGIQTLKQNVKEICLVGYSMGALLSIYHALNDSNISKIILISPSLHVRSLVHLVLKWNIFLNTLYKKQWIFLEKEVDYAKYRSTPVNAVTQFYNLINATKTSSLQNLKSGMLMVLSADDETISSKQALEFFLNNKNELNKLILYATHPLQTKDERIFFQSSQYPDLNIQNFSHVSLLFSKNNSHYGCEGDFPFASRNDQHCMYGAYNRLKVSFFESLLHLNIIKKRHLCLTYNPDFKFMAKTITEFILERTPA